MLENLLLYITACFNIGALHIFKVGRMVLRNDRRRFWWAESLRLRVGDFCCGVFRSDKTFGVKDMVSDLGVFRTGVAPRWPGEGGWIQRLMNVSRKALGRLDAGHRRGHSQILTTAP